MSHGQLKSFLNAPRTPVIVLLWLVTLFGAWHVWHCIQTGLYVTVMENGTESKCLSVIWLTWGVPLDHIVSHMNSDHILIPCFFKINFNITFLPLFMSAKQCLPLRSCDQNFLCFVMRVLKIFSLASTVMQNMPEALWYHQNLINGKKFWQSKTQSLNDQDTWKIVYRLLICRPFGFALLNHGILFIISRVVYLTNVKICW